MLKQIPMDPRQSTVLDLRQANRARVLRRILLDGKTTRATLAEQCQLSPSTVANVIRDLVDDGLVEEGGSLPSNGGRPITCLQPRQEGAHVIGVDVGEHGAVAELFGLTLERRDREVRRAHSSAGGSVAVAGAVVEAVEALLDRNPDASTTTVGMGLGVPGVVETDEDGRAVVHADHLGWEPILVSDLAPMDLPVIADNGAKAQAAAEAWCGAARDVEHSIVVLIGHGIGAAVISDGRLLRGTSGSAGEWGHSKISTDGPACSCGGRGCLEASVGGGALAARWLDAAGHTSSLDEEETLDEIVRAGASGHEVANDILSGAVATLGQALANLVNLLNPEQIVIGGWAGLRLMATRERELMASIRANSLPRPFQRVRIERVRLGDDAVALGAGLLPLEQFIEGYLPVRKAPA